MKNLMLTLVMGVSFCASGLFAASLGSTTSKANQMLGSGSDTKVPTAKELEEMMEKARENANIRMKKASKFDKLAGNAAYDVYGAKVSDVTAKEDLNRPRKIAETKARISTLESEIINLEREIAVLNNDSALKNDGDVAKKEERNKKLREKNGKKAEIRQLKIALGTLEDKQAEVDYVKASAEQRQLMNAVKRKTASKLREEAARLDEEASSDEESSSAVAHSATLLSSGSERSDDEGANGSIMANGSSRTPSPLPGTVLETR